MNEELILVLGDDTPAEVKEEVTLFKDSAVLNFSCEDEDSECMPLLAKYLEIKYNLFKCGII